MASGAAGSLSVPVTSLLCFINKWGTDAHSLETAAEPPLRRTLGPTLPPELTDASLDPLAASGPFAGGASVLDKLQARCSGWGEVESEPGTRGQNLHPDYLTCAPGILIWRWGAGPPPRLTGEPQRCGQVDTGFHPARSRHRTQGLQHREPHLPSWWPVSQHLEA